MITTTAIMFSATFAGQPRQVREIRRAVAGCLAGCPAADDVVLIASELASNAILHSRSRDAFLAVRVAVLGGGCRVEVEDLGGPWSATGQDDGRPHGLDLVEILSDEWGTEVTPGGRVTWAVITWT